MSGDVTPRDRVWAAILKSGCNGNSFKVASVRREIDFENRPSDETIRRVLRAGKELGVIKHTSGSQYYELANPALSRRIR